MTPRQAGLRAVLRDGTEAAVDPVYGPTVGDLHAALSRGSLTGSAVPFADAVVKLADGREVPYSDVEMFVELDSAF